MVYLIVAVGILAGLAYFTFFRNSKSKKEEKDKIEVDTSVDRFEKLNFKKCRQCGGEVPKEDNICPHCNQIP